ncbi:autotransporter domain-containing protein [Alienimonas sp. DA493]|uniref:autotransporter outer membrane beta-barrel domain-containing protein n=1 Tax=Alienimonas sp. DA493 TaxID=3373605 RepID=UPI0037553A77
METTSRPRRSWFRRALPWLPAAALALTLTPSAAKAQTVTIGALSVTTETPPNNVVAAPFFPTVEDVQVIGSLSVSTNTGWVKAEDLQNFGTVTIGADALITTQFGGTLLPGNGVFTDVQYQNEAGATTNVFGRLVVGSPTLYSGAAGETGPAAGALGSGVLSVTGGTVAALGGGEIAAGALDVSGGVFTTSGGGSTTVISGSATAGGPAATVVRGTGLLNTANGATFDTLAALIDGAGAEVRVSGGATMTADSLTQTDGLLDVRAAGTLTVAGLVDPLDPLDISGIADFSDQVRINGTLNATTTLLNAGSVLTGGGTINGDVLAAGTIAPGDTGAVAGSAPTLGANGRGVLNIGGNYFGDGVNYDIEVLPGSSSNTVAGVDFDQINVAGLAVIDGGTVDVFPVPAGADAASFAVGRQYRFITAAGGLVVLDPVIVNNPRTDLRLIPFIGPNSYSLVVGRNVPLSTFANTFNTRQVARALDVVSTDPNLSFLLNALDTRPTQAQVLQAVNGLSGEVYATQMTALNRNSLQFLDVIAGQDAAFPLVCGTCGVNGRNDVAWQGWTHTYAASGRVSGDGNAFPAELDSAGLVVGATRIFGRSNACLALSGFFGTEVNTTEVNVNRVGDAESVVNDEVHRLGAYLRGSAGRVHGRLTGVVGVANAESRRSYVLDDSQGGIPFADVTGAEYESILGAVDSEVGYLFGSPVGFIMPVAGLRYVETDRDEFAEAGGITSLYVGDSFLKEVRARAGLRTGNQLTFVPWAPTSFTMEAFYSRDVSAASVGDIDTRLDSAPAAAFTARGTDFGAHRFVLGPGLSVGIGPVQFSARYRAALTEYSTVHSGNANLEVCF